MFVPYLRIDSLALQDFFVFGRIVGQATILSERGSRAPAALGTVDLSLYRSRSVLPKRLRRIHLFIFGRIVQPFYHAVRSMISETREGDREMSKPQSVLEPLPSLNVTPSVEKLDAGLRGLDHCKFLLQNR